MPISSAKTRARDLDRAQARAVLDAVYEEGQLSPDEHVARSEAAMRAATLGELRGLTADLQIADYLLGPAAPAPTRRPRRRRALLAGGLAAVLVAGAGVAVAVAVSVSVSGKDGGADAAAAPTAPQPLPAGEPAPIVLEPIDTLSADGFRQFLALFQQRFGGTTVDDLSLYGDSAIVTLAVPGQPHREQDWMFEGGFQRWSSPSSRDRDQETVDLAALDADAFARLLADAPELVRLPSGRADRAILRPTEDGPEITVYVQDTDERSGNLTATPAGDVLRVQAADR